MASLGALKKSEIKRTRVREPKRCSSISWHYPARSGGSLQDGPASLAKKSRFCSTFHASFAYTRTVNRVTLSVYSLHMRGEHVNELSWIPRERTDADQLVAGEYLRGGTVGRPPLPRGPGPAHEHVHAEAGRRELQDVRPLRIARTTRGREHEEDFRLHHLRRRKDRRRPHRGLPEP